MCLLSVPGPQGLNWTGSGKAIDNWQRWGMWGILLRVAGATLDSLSAHCASGSKLGLPALPFRGPGRGYQTSLRVPPAPKWAVTCLCFWAQRVVAEIHIQAVQEGGMKERPWAPVHRTELPQGLCCVHSGRTWLLEGVTRAGLALGAEGDGLHEGDVVGKRSFSASALWPSSRRHLCSRRTAHWRAGNTQRTLLTRSEAWSPSVHHRGGGPHSLRGHW